MKKFLALGSLLIIFMASCSDTVEEFQFTCTLNGSSFTANETPTVSILNDTMWVNALFDSTRIQLTTFYAGPDTFYTGADTNGTALIQYWPDKNNLTNFYSSDTTDTSGNIIISEITSARMTGTFTGTIYHPTLSDILVENGNFIGKRP